MITIIALVLQVLMALVTPSNSDVVVIPAVITEPDHAIAYDQGCMCEDCYWVECYEEAISEFDSIFNGLTYKRTKNGRSMVNGKFVKMGA